MSTHESSEPPRSPPATNGANAPPAGGQQTSEHSTDTTIETPTSSPPGGASLPFGNLVVQECLLSAQRFRAGEYSREEAMYRIFDTLGRANQPQAVVFQAARLYIDMLDKIVAEQ